MAVSVNGVGVPDADDYYQRIKGESSLVAYFPLTEPLGADKRVLDTHGGRVATVNGTPTTSDASVPYGGRAITLDGDNDWIDIPYSAAMNPAAITVELWVRRDTDTGAAERIFDCCASNKGIRFFVNATDGITIVSGDGAALSTSMAGAVTLSTGQWYHIAVTHDGTTAKLYVNGVFDGSGVDTYSANVSAVSRLGANIDGTGDFPGKIAHVAIYNTALTPAQINRHYSAYADAVLQLAPVGYWRLNEPSGTAAVDLGSGAHNGVYANTPTLGDTGGLRSDPSKAMTVVSASDEYMSVADHADHDGDTSFTTCFWFKSSDSGSQTLLVGKVASALNSSPGWVCGWTTSNAVRVKVGDGTNIALQSIGAVEVFDGKWHFIAAGRDDSTERTFLYVDAVSRGTPADTTAVGSIANTEALEVLRVLPNTNPAADGTAQDLAFFNRALSATEIAYLYQLGKAGLTHPIKYVQS